MGNPEKNRRILGPPPFKHWGEEQTKLFLIAICQRKPIGVAQREVLEAYPDSFQYTDQTLAKKLTTPEGRQQLLEVTHDYSDYARQNAFANAGVRIAALNEMAMDFEADVRELRRKRKKGEKVSQSEIINVSREVRLTLTNIREEMEPFVDKGRRTSDYESVMAALNKRDAKSWADEAAPN